MTPTDELLAAAKATEWEDNKKLFDTHKKEQEVTEWQEKYTQKEKAEKEEKLNNKILSVLPKDIAIAKALTIIHDRLSFAEEDGKLAILKGRKEIHRPFRRPRTIRECNIRFYRGKGMD